MLAHSLLSSDSRIQDQLQTGGKANKEHQRRHQALAESSRLEYGLQDLQLPREVIDRLRSTVFGFDTFFVTNVENYQADGILFKGNLRGSASVAFEKMQRRLKNELGDSYVLFLLLDKESKPVVALFPSSALEEQAALVPQAPVALLFALITLATTLNACGVPILPVVLGADVDLLDPDFLLPAIPGTLATLAILAAHEIGHIVAAKKEGAELAPPFLIPAGLGIIGSFGAVTTIKSTLRDRASLLKIATAGPTAGSAASLAFVVLGLVLTLTGVGADAQVETGAFNDSLFMGFLGQSVFGDTLNLEPVISLHPFVLAGWAGLVINGLNLIPMGELDGGRIAHSIWGRRPFQLINVVLTILLGLAGIIDSLALYWILLILTLQRGPIQPQQEEISAPADTSQIYLGLALLAVPLLTLIPYPGDVTAAPF